MAQFETFPMSFIISICGFCSESKWKVWESLYPCIRRSCQLYFMAFIRVPLPLTVMQLIHPLGDTRETTSMNIKVNVAVWDVKRSPAGFTSSMSQMKQSKISFYVTLALEEGWLAELFSPKAKSEGGLIPKRLIMISPLSNTLVPVEIGRRSEGPCTCLYSWSESTAFSEESFFWSLSHSSYNSTIQTIEKLNIWQVYPSSPLQCNLLQMCITIYFVGFLRLVHPSAQNAVSNTVKSFACLFVTFCLQFKWDRTNVIEHLS